MPEDTIQLQLPRLGRAELRRVRAARHHAALEGDVNDYCGKGLSGGKIIVYPAARGHVRRRREHHRRQRRAVRRHERRSLLRGIAGERFCVRNSGASAVVEGVGDHGCEYMTGGARRDPGPTGRNFAAGMSGGIAYVLDDAGALFARRCNKEMVEPRQAGRSEEVALVHDLVRAHAEFTGLEARAGGPGVAGTQLVPKFVKVMPNDYKRVLEAQAKMRAAGLSEEEAEMAAFEPNAKDAARLGG